MERQPGNKIHVTVVKCSPDQQVGITNIEFLKSPITFLLLVACSRGIREKGNCGETITEYTYIRLM